MMRCFREILVGVDLSAGDRLVGSSLAAPSEHAVQQALWLAKLHGARLKFLYALDVSARAWRLIREAAGESSVLDQARRALAALVRESEAEGVAASCEAVVGKSRPVLVQHVLDAGHDLVIVGSRNRATIPRALFGGTAIDLLRKCPCPVWIAKPSARPAVASVLVAHDLTEVGTAALQLGASIAELQGAALHVLHSVEDPEHEHMVPFRIPAGAASERGAAARAQIKLALKDFELATPPKVVLSDDLPSAALLKYLAGERIELVVMAGAAGDSQSGVITASTAERLLASIRCSLLAVTPEGLAAAVARSTTRSVV